MKTLIILSNLLQSTFGGGLAQGLLGDPSVAPKCSINGDPFPLVGKDYYVPSNPRVCVEQDIFNFRKVHQLIASADSTDGVAIQPSIYLVC